MRTHYFSISLRQAKWHLGLCLVLLSHWVYAEFSINYARTHLVEEVYLLDADLSYGLTEVVLEALQNGVPLTLVLTIVVKRERWYFWDEKIATLRQRYQLKYYAFSQQYVVKNLNTEIRNYFSSLHAALQALEHLTSFPLIDKQLIKPNQQYQVHLQTHLDIESLPVPLRPIAYLSSQWRLSSRWYLCPLHPPKSENG